jgi:hypothetical protein
MTLSDSSIITNIEGEMLGGQLAREILHWKGSKTGNKTASMR